MSESAPASNRDTDSTAPTQTDPLTGVDNIILVAVFVATSHAHSGPHHTKPSFIDRMKDIKNKGLVSEQSLEKEKDGRLRMVHMPRAEYLKYFAKDKDGRYVGTEPERTWTEEEVNQIFGMYQLATEKKSGGQVFDSMMKGLGGPEGWGTQPHSLEKY